MKFSIVIPVYDMENGEALLKRNLDSILKQNFSDYEIVVSDGAKGKFNELLGHYPVRLVLGRDGMAHNANTGIDNAKGDIVKLLFQDDYFYTTKALSTIAKHLTPSYMWLACACTHTTDGVNFFNPHKPFYSKSENTIGSPSVVAFRREIEERLNPDFKWVLDLDFYHQLFQAYGLPKLLNQTHIAIGIHQGQETYKLSDEIKIQEHQLINNQ